MARSWETLYQQAIQGDDIIQGHDHAEFQLLRRKAARGKVTKLRKNLYAVDDIWSNKEPDARIRAIVRALSGQKRPPVKVYCLVTAAVLWNLDVPLHLLTDAKLHAVGHQSSYPHSDLYQYFPITKPRTTTVDDVTLTDLPQTLRDCAHHLSFPDALAIIESALRSGLTEQFQPELQRARQEDSLFNRVFMHASKLSESVGESIAKATMIELGFQYPLQQVVFSRPHSQPPGGDYRVDFLWMGDQGVIVGEFDGVRKYYRGGDDIDSQVSLTVAKERERDAHLHQRGVTQILHFDYRMVMNRATFRRYLTDAAVPRVRVC